MRIAIVGAGWAGKVHAEAYASMDEVEVAAIVARSDPGARLLAEKIGTRATTDLAGMLSDPSIDAVDVCVPSGAHRSIATDALERGKHVFMETPIALTLEDSDAMLAVAKDHGLILSVGQVMKFVVPYAMIRIAFRRGDLGEPKIVHAARLSGPYWSDKKPRDFSRYGVPMVELMIFEYEVMHWLLGKPLAVSAKGVPGPDGHVLHALVTLDYGGHIALVEGSAMMPRSWPFTTYLRVQGAKGTLETRDRFLGGDVPATEFLRYGPEGKMETVEFEGRDPHLAECEHFVRCLAGEADPTLIAAGDAREALAVALAALRSVESGEPVPVR